VPPGYRDRQPAGKTWPCTPAPAVRSSQVQVHVTNFDYNHHLLNTMPGARLSSFANTAARSRPAQPSRAEPQTTHTTMQSPGDPPAKRQGNPASQGKKSARCAFGSG
jgi:hypothetical protein